jgi:hypothetical protein
MPLQNHSLKELTTFLSTDRHDTPMDKLPTPMDARPATPTKRPSMSDTSRTKYADFFDGLDDYLRQADDLSDAVDASETTRTHIQHIHKAMDLAENSSQAAADTYRTDRTPTFKTNDDARAKLRAMLPKQVINVDYEMATTIRSLCSYYNSKENGPRFETRRAPSNPNILQIKRTR